MSLSGMSLGGGTWDVMATADHDDLSWFAFSAARHLADRHAKPVRLFVSSMTQLGERVPQVDSKLWLQDLHGVQVLDARLADVCSPAKNLLQIFDSRIPLSYADRFAASRVPRNWYRVGRLGATPSGASIKAVNRTSSCVVYDVEQGAIPAGAGFMKDRRDHLSMRLKWSGDWRARATTLRLAGIDGVLSSSQGSSKPKIAVMHVDNPLSVLAWIDALKSFDTPVHLVLSGMSRQCAAAAGIDIAPGNAMRVGNLSVGIMSEMPWHLQDEVMWAADFVLTSCESIAMRAMSGGCPMIWCGPQEQGTSNVGDASQHSLRRWYVNRADAMVKLVCAQASAALKTGGGAALAWRAMIESEELLQAHAAQVAESINRSPNTIDVIVASCGADSVPMRIHDFAPTQPGLDRVAEEMA